MQNSRDKFGFYKVGDLKFYSKFDAADLSSRTNQSMTWHYNDEVFTACDWTQEPTQSLADLYRQRAQQLRDSYDYLVLWYSGGSDSDNILDTFIDNNIKLDEVAGYVNIEATKNTHGHMNSEIYYLTVPKIQTIKQTQQPWIRHTLIDMCKPTMNYFTNAQNKFDWIYKVNEYVNPNYFARVQSVKHQRHWQELTAQGKSIGFIWGIDKPKVCDINGHFYFAFQDIVDIASTTSHQQVDPEDGHHTELFYWTPDLPELLVKQCHLLKSFITKITLPTNLLTPNRAESSRADSVTVKQKKMYWLSAKATSRILYPNWYDRPFQNNKPTSLIFSERDNWFFALPDNDPAKIVWRQGLEYRWANTPDFLKNDPTNMSRDFKILNSKQYYIGPLHDSNGK